MGLINKVDMVCLSPVGYGLLRQRAYARNVSKTPYPTGDKHTISTLLIKPIYIVCYVARQEINLFAKTSGSYKCQKHLVYSFVISQPYEQFEMR